MGRASMACGRGPRAAKRVAEHSRGRHSMWQSTAELEGRGQHSVILVPSKEPVMDLLNSLTSSDGGICVPGGNGCTSGKRSSPTSAILLLCRRRPFL